MKSFNEFIGESRKDSTIIIEDLKVWPLALGEMTWPNAMGVVKNLGPDWRLPTIIEFKEILYPNKEKLSINTDAYYWSSSEFDNYDAWYFDFDSGDAYPNGKVSTYFVLAVQDNGIDLIINDIFRDF
jgi:hypothetical protein